MPFRILSMDGGGAWSLIQVRTLIALYDATTLGHDVLADFDMVAANSGGSLVLAGLIENLSLGDILALFETEANRRAIFSPTHNVGDDALRSLAGIGPKYSAAAKLPAIQHLLPKTGATPFQQVLAGINGASGKPVRGLVIAFDYDTTNAVFFRSSATDNEAWGISPAAKLSLAEAVHASTNAPVDYFDGPALIPGSAERFWDGAITGQNNPALVACIEALTMGCAPTDLRILSLGTATVRLPLAEPGAPVSPYKTARSPSSLVTDLRKLASAILDDPPDFATFAVHAITGGNSGLPPGIQSRIVRMSPLISPVPVGPLGTAPAGWNAAQFQYICSLDVDAIEPAQVTYIDDWCSLWIRDGSRNQPIRMDNETLATVIGNDTFSQAKAAWQTFAAGSPVTA